MENTSKILKLPLRTRVSRSPGISATPIFSLPRLILVSISQGWGSSDCHSVNATPKLSFPMPLYLLLVTANEQLLIKRFVIHGKSNLMEFHLAILNGRNTSTAWFARRYVESLVWQSETHPRRWSCISSCFTKRDPSQSSFYLHLNCVSQECFHNSFLPHQE